MTSQKKSCRNCKAEFTIEPEDFAFYQKIKVPAPTWCPQCRLQRRLIFQNERALYSRPCDLCSKKIISVYHADAAFPVYCGTCWFSDKWDPLSFGKEFDFSRPFFEQFSELTRLVPRIALNTEVPKNVNSPYVNLAGPMKNSHLVFYASNVEDSLYCTNIFFSKDCVDCTKIDQTEISYELVNCCQCYGSRWSTDCSASFNLLFCRNCVNCADCFGCVNLRHKKNCWFNEQLTPSEYKKRLSEFNSSSRKEVENVRQRARDFWLSHPTQFIHGHENENVSGDYIDNSKNVHHSFQVLGAENVKFGYWLNMAGAKDCYDYSNWGENSDLVYECNNSGQNTHNAKFSLGSWVGANWEYCDTVNQCHDCFGCILLRGKSNCILNKQYTPQAYATLRANIVEHMHRTEEYGQFFPPTLSPFAYNESSAQQFFPLTKQQAVERGYKWREPEGKSHMITLRASKIPDDTAAVHDSILKEVIECKHKGRCAEQCTQAFTVIPKELAFYRKHNLPLPVLCPNCRHYARMQDITPMRLHPRQCMCDYKVYKNETKHKHHESGRCPNEFETSYAPDRPEIVYCEKCYQAEVV